MKKITILVGFEATEETINSMSAGAMVELKREPTNTADPNAIQVFLDGALVGYVAADPKKTVLKGTSSNAVVAKNMDKPSVAGCFAKLLNAQPYGDDNKRMRWEAELYWVPVWEDKPKESEDGPLVLKVGGSRVRYGKIRSVLEDINSYKGGKLVARMFETGEKGVYEPQVWVAGEMSARDASPAGKIEDAPSELIAALNAKGTIPVEPTNVLGGGAYEIAVTLESSSMDEFFSDMEEVIKKGIMQARDIKARVVYLMEQGVPSTLIHGVLQSMKCNDTGAVVIKPKQLFLQGAEDNYLTRCLGYHLAGKNIRLVGEKGAGKNTLVYTVCWVLNKALTRIQGNSDMDKIDLLGGQALDDHGTHFELSSFIEMLMKGGDVVLDEINSVKPEIAIIIHSLADDARSIEVPGYGFVTVHPDSRIWATMNEEYVGTGMLNSATADRFVPIYLEDQMDLVKLLTSMVPGADKIAIKTCATIYEKIRKAIKDGKLSNDALTTRGFIDALEAAKWLPMRAALLDNVGCRPQDPDERRTVCDFIRAVYPA